MVKGFNLANYLMVALIMLLRHASKNLGSRAVAKNKRFEKVWLNLNNPTTNVIITIVVMDEDQNWFRFENGSYMNESPLPTFDYRLVNQMNCFN
jgi:hypothetical protein